MLRSLEQSCRCLCQCAKGRLPTISVIPSRAYQNPNTAVLERRTPVGLVGAGKFPKLKRRHTILKKINTEEQAAYTNTIKCILTETVSDIGIKGSLVEVTKRVFRNQLYPGGKAIYASPENLEIYKDQIEELQAIDQDLMAVMNELSQCHIRIFMHKTNDWTIKSEHVRIACRQVGIVVADENIILPDEPIKEFTSFVFHVQALGKLRTKVRATVYEILDKKIDLPHEFKSPIFGNKPIDPKMPVEYLVEAKTNNTENGR